mmetsp:Transcript_2987/g.6996  ORF Transcript_2987/g.6996 Transcript_2987/m.6996 type:complete len:271 (-) Transcript_2987:779-1591(-)
MLLSRCGDERCQTDRQQEPAQERLQIQGDGASRLSDHLRRLDRARGAGAGRGHRDLWNWKLGRRCHSGRDQEQAGVRVPLLRALHQHCQRRPSPRCVTCREQDQVHQQGGGGEGEGGLHRVRRSCRRWRRQGAREADGVGVEEGDDRHQKRHAREHPVLRRQASGVRCGRLHAGARRLRRGVGQRRRGAHLRLRVRRQERHRAGSGAQGEDPRGLQLEARRAWAAESVPAGARAARLQAAPGSGAPPQQGGARPLGADAPLRPLLAPGGA